MRKDKACQSRSTERVGSMPKTGISNKQTLRNVKSQLSNKGDSEVYIKLTDRLMPELHTKSRFCACWLKEHYNLNIIVSATETFPGSWSTHSSFKEKMLNKKFWHLLESGWTLEEMSLMHAIESNEWACIWIPLLILRDVSLAIATPWFLWSSDYDVRAAI